MRAEIFNLPHGDTHRILFRRSAVQFGDADRRENLLPPGAVRCVQGKKTEGTADLKKCIEFTNSPSLREFAEQVLSQFGAK